MSWFALVLHIDFNSSLCCAQGQQRPIAGGRGALRWSLKLCQGAGANEGSYNCHLTGRLVLQVVL